MDYNILSNHNRAIILIFFNEFQNNLKNIYILMNLEAWDFESDCYEYCELNRFRQEKLTNKDTINPYKYNNILTDLYLNNIC